MLWFTETKSGNQLAVNPKYIVVAFTVADEGEFLGKTGISMINGSIIVEDNLLDVVGQITGANQ